MTPAILILVRTGPDAGCEARPEVRKNSPRRMEFDELVRAKTGLLMNFNVSKLKSRSECFVLLRALRVLRGETTLYLCESFGISPFLQLPTPVCSIHSRQAKRERALILTLTCPTIRRRPCKTGGRKACGSRFTHAGLHGAMCSEANTTCCCGLGVLVFSWCCTSEGVG